MRGGEEVGTERGTKKESRAKGEEKLGRRFRGMCPWRLKTPQPLTNRSSTLGWERGKGGGGGRTPECSGIAPLHKALLLVSTIISPLSVWKRNFCYFGHEEYMDTHHKILEGLATHWVISPDSALCRGSCVCLNVLMDTRQMKGMYSGSLCARLRWCLGACGFYPSLSRAPPSAFLGVIVAVSGWRLEPGGCQSGWGVGVPVLGPMPLHSQTAAAQGSCSWPCCTWAQYVSVTGW